MTRQVSRLAALRADPTLASLHRSLGVYYDSPGRDTAMDQLYARFLQPGDLAFDIGSHVGDRVAAFRRRGARVVTLEPQPDCVRVLQALYGDDAGVQIVEAACGRAPGSLTLHINSHNPTVTTLSTAFVTAAGGAAGWEDQAWDHAIEVPVTTLDQLLAEHGRPAFVKIDVEGFEDHVLAGLTQPVPALSFEFTTIQREIVARCLHRLGTLAPYAFDLALGESQRLELDRWVTAAEIQAMIDALPDSANSGDVYAVLAA